MWISLISLSLSIGINIVIDMDSSNNMNNNSSDWKDHVYNKLFARNQRECYPFTFIYDISSKLQSDNDFLEMKLIAVMRKISILRHDNTQALSDIMSSSSAAASASASSSSAAASPTSTSTDEAINILIQTLDVTRSQLSSIQNELRSVNSDKDGQERYQRIVLNEKIRAQQHIINQQNDELLLAKEEIKRILEQNLELQKRVK